MSRSLVLATRNPGKILEMSQLLSGLELNLLTFRDFEGWPELEETGKTFEENAFLKASKLSEWAQVIALADDSGLEVDALSGRPGVHSSRYAGEEGNAEANIALLLREMADISEEKRKARFVCVISLYNPDGQSLEIRETCEGAITFQASGTSGFGYDPVFMPAGMARTMAQLFLDEKNAISHRGKAIRQLRELFERGQPEWLFD